MLVINRININVLEMTARRLSAFHRQKTAYSSAPCPLIRQLKWQFLVNASDGIANLLIIREFYSLI